MKQNEVDIQALVDETLSVMPLIPKKLFRDPQLLEEGDLHPTHFHILHIVQCSHSLSMGAIAKKLAIKKSNLTPLIQKLIDKNLIVRIKAEKDRRITYIELTEEGKAFLEEKKDLLQQDAKSRLEKLSKEEQEIFQEAISNLRTILSKLED